MKKAAIREQRANIQKIVNNKKKPNFQNTILAYEESGGSTTAYMVERGYGAKKIILILDAAPYGIAHAQKGIISLTLRANGKGGHSSEPWALSNPIDLLVDGYVKLRAAWPALPADHWGDSMTPCIISGGQAFNQIPDTAEMVLNIRFIVLRY